MEFISGEGAFYGPKLEFNLKDSLGRTWQCGTIQLDFSMPERLGADYINPQGDKVVPVMLHRAILGSLERFMGIVIENCAGWLPLWMAPVQVAIMGISDKHADYAQTVYDTLQKNQVRVLFDSRPEKVGFKIREHTLAKIPLMVIVGDEEVSNQVVNLRGQQGKQYGSMTVESLLQLIKDESKGE